MFLEQLNSIADNYELNELILLISLNAIDKKNNDPFPLIDMVQYF